MRKVPEPPARGWRQRRRPVPPVDTSRQDRLDEARRHYDDAARPHLDKLDSQITDTDTRLAGLRQARQQRATWERDHPDAGRRLTRLYEELQLLEGSRYRERRREHGRPSGNDILYRSRGIERDDPGRGLSR
jgi:hypothetical protein